ADVHDGRPGSDDGPLHLGTVYPSTATDRGVWPDVRVKDLRFGADDRGSNYDAFPDRGALVNRHAPFDSVPVAARVAMAYLEPVEDNPVQLEQVERVACIGAP